MNPNTKAPRGTQDMLPRDCRELEEYETIFTYVAELYGFREIRTPVFEHTELFNRSVGETTDVVQKEMYTFLDNGGRSITLRPEGTAGVVRAVIEHGLYGEAMPLKFFYNTSCYRYEKPQAGRLREFHQFGVECFGSALPSADAEIISLAKHFLDEVGASHLRLELNSIGCPTCRKEYQKALKAYFEERKGELCETCLGRLEKNPMRILDCKSPICSEIANDAPIILDYLCDDCREHFKKVQEYLSIYDIDFVVNPHVVRGLDYYTRTVFEFVSDQIGAQGTVCAGGRYDGLVRELGGNDLPALGFGLGVERLRLLLKTIGADYMPDDDCDIFLACVDPVAEPTVMKLVQTLRRNCIEAEMDICGRSLKAQMKYANKINASFTAVIGADEIKNGYVLLKDMHTGETEKVPLQDLVSHMKDLIEYLSLHDFFGDEEEEQSPNYDGLTMLRGGKDKYRP